MNYILFLFCAFTLGLLVRSLLYLKHNFGRLVTDPEKLFVVRFLVFHFTELCSTKLDMKLHLVCVELALANTAYDNGNVLCA